MKKKEDITACYMCKNNKKLPVLNEDGFHYHGSSRCKDREWISSVRRNIRKKCKVEIIECVYVDFTGMKNRAGYIGKDDGVVHKFMRFCLDNDMLGLRTAGTSGAGVYARCHKNSEKKRIIEFFESEGIEVTLYTS